MPRSLNARLRRLWLDVHLWVGAGLLAALVPLTLSGAILMWREPIDHALNPERYAVSGSGQVGIDVYAAAAQAGFGGRAQLSQIRLPQQAGDPVVAVGRMPGPPGAEGRSRMLNAWIDPPSARVLGTGEIAKGLTMTAHRLHESLLIPQTGRKVVGWLGWAMFASCATGLWLWWPRHGRFLAGLRWRRGASQLFNLHHALGFWICLPLAMYALTGVIIAFPETASRLAGAEIPVGRGEMRARFAATLLAAPATPLSTAVATAEAAHPGGRIRSVTWPQQGKRPAWRIEIAEAGSPVTVVVADDSGTVQPAGRGAAAGPTQRSPFLAWARGLHNGSDFGPAWRTTLGLAGLAPTVLGVTGVVMWLRRRARRRAVAAHAWRLWRSRRAWRGREAEPPSPFPLPLRCAGGEEEDERPPLLSPERSERGRG
jgi:uncharacterized iron-regulated membrane protein